MNNAKTIARALLKSDKLDIKLNVPMSIIPVVYDGRNIQTVLADAIAPLLLDEKKLAEWLLENKVIHSLLTSQSYYSMESDVLSVLVAAITEFKESEGHGG